MARFEVQKEKAENDLRLLHPPPASQAYLNIKPASLDIKKWVGFHLHPLQILHQLQHQHVKLGRFVGNIEILITIV